jgi:hypothetical protein
LPINGQKSPVDEDKSRQLTDCVAGMFLQVVSDIGKRWQTLVIMVG